MITAIRHKKNELIKFVRSEGFKKYFSNTSWLFFDRFVSLVIGFGAGVMVARYLGANEYGLLSFAKSTAKISSVVCALGLEKIIVKRFIDDENKHNDIMGTGLGLKLISALLCTAIVSFIGFFVFEDSLTHLLVIVFTSVTLFESFIIIRFFFQSKVQTKYVARIVTYKVIISTTIKLFLIYLHAPLIYFAFEALFESVLVAVGYIYIYRKKSNNNLFQWKWNFSYGKSLLKDSWPLLISGFVVFIYMEVDILMLKYMVGNEAVGYYSIAARFTNLWNMAGIIICSSLFPAILNAKKNNENQYKSRFSSLLRLLVAISFAISLVVFFGGGWFINLLFGAEYLSAVPSLNILIWSVVFVNLGIASQQWHIAEGLQKKLLMRTSLGALVNLVLNVILIPMYGIIGAAIATIVAQIVATYLSNSFSVLTRPLFIMQTKSLVFLK